ncbi:MAG TPA: DISARM system helicase DrmA [Terriglobia bacterium]|nr:DISARM system helicase DrmA [Terriglobia bacterium]
MNPVDVRAQLIEALRLDLIGPGEVLSPANRVLGDLAEILPQRPSSWYLAGFLVPLDAAPEQKTDDQSADEIDVINDGHAQDDAVTPEPAAARVRYLPSSIGVSVLVAPDTKALQITARWGDYKARKSNDNEPGPYVWIRTQRDELVPVEMPSRMDQPIEIQIPKSDGLRLVVSLRPVTTRNTEIGLPAGTRSASIFLVNRRTPLPDEIRDQACAFQAQLQIHSDHSFVSRPDLQSLESEDWDNRVADLQYRDACEFAVGHNIATEAVSHEDNTCRIVRTSWIPDAEVERVAPAEIKDVELSMDVLSQLADFDEARRKLGGFVAQYREWIEAQRAKIPHSPQRRRETAEELLNRAHVAATRIEKGIHLLADTTVFAAFQLTNRVMASAVRQRLGAMQGKDPQSIQPTWRPFQLAFLLMNLGGIVEPASDDREVVDLLFFPTGGGKTEAYFGLAAFTLFLRRLRNSGIASAGLTVLMRYTLRLLTLDQLGRAATLICAMELERQSDVDKLGKWPFEIGLWVGKAATPNVMGRKGDSNSDSARARTIAFKNDDRKPSPIPLEECPWCGTKFKGASFQLVPNPDSPNDLRVICVNRNCAFTRDNALPILAVDEPIYRRLPCFMIATVDKFAAMPWTGGVGQFFGRVRRYDKNGFYGACDPLTGDRLPTDQLPPPDLIIQDELHLISGPLGTVFGLYETALDRLCERQVNGKKIRPKIVASTATVRRAENQIRALFNHRLVDIFPPPGPDRRDSFFAEVHSTAKSNARMYLGVAAQGRSPKVVMLRTYLALLAAAQKAYAAGKKNDPQNAADPYMSLVGYFNSLRELGGARRLIEDEVGNRVAGYASRKRVSETDGLFQNRKIDYDVVELTSRVATDKVAEYKQRLALPFNTKEHVDVAIATNMISVGLDITRLGLMVVFGQPKTSAEYIQATSRVGRDHGRPGLVVTILNVHKPRDRSHYERFAAYHQSFYRAVEVTSVTPFSPRALDRALAGTLVALARQGHDTLTPPRGAHEILVNRPDLDFVVEALAERAQSHSDLPKDEADRLRQRVRERSLDLLDEWTKIAMELNKVGGVLQYQLETGGAQRLLYEFLHPDLKRLPPRHRKFRANRSMRDVEPDVNLWLRTIDGIEIEEEEAE